MAIINNLEEIKGNLLVVPTKYTKEDRITFAKDGITYSVCVSDELNNRMGFLTKNNISKEIEDDVIELAVENTKRFVPDLDITSLIKVLALEEFDENFDERAMVDVVTNKKIAYSTGIAITKEAIDFYRDKKNYEGVIIIQPSSIYECIYVKIDEDEFESEKEFYLNMVCDINKTDVVGKYEIAFDGIVISKNRNHYEILKEK